MIGCKTDGLNTRHPKSTRLKVYYSDVSVIWMFVTQIATTILVSGGHAPATFDRVCSGLRPPFTVQHDIDLLAHLATLGKPGAKVIICQAVNSQVI